jgi:glucose/arabinose dehydrogenase
MSEFLHRSSVQCVSFLYAHKPTPSPPKKKRSGDLYVSGWDAGSGDGCIWRARGIDAYALQRRVYPRGALERVSCRLPRDRWHGERYMRFGPDGLLYVSVGAPCDVCLERKTPSGIKTATIYTLNTTLGDEGWQLYARGVRNSVGFDWHPESGALYFTDNGRDGLGDNKPDDKLLRAPVRGKFYGYPYCHVQGRGDPYRRDSGPAGHGAPLPDPKLNQGERSLACGQRGTYVRPVQALGPHVAALGLRFYRRNASAPGAWPAAYDNALLIAQHGSWNRTSKIGYRVAALRVAEPKTASAAAAANAATSTAEAAGYGELVTGFLGGKRGAPKDAQPSWGRPVDVQQLPDGSVLVSDDGAHTVYRVAYTGRDAAAGASALFESGPAPAGGGRAAASAARLAVPSLLLVVMAGMLLAALE